MNDKFIADDLTIMRKFVNVRSLNNVLAQIIILKIQMTHTHTLKRITNNMKIE